MKKNFTSVLAPGFWKNLVAVMAVVCTVFWNQKAVAQALHFDATNDKVDVGQLIDWDWTQPFSVVAWVNPSVTTPNRIIIATRTDAGTGSEGIQFQLFESEKPMFYLLNTSGQQLQVVANTSVPLNQWSQVAATYDGSGNIAGVHLYINGAEVAHGTTSDTFVSGTVISGNNTFIGHHASDTGVAGNANYDELSVWTYVLSATEVANFYTCPPFGTEPGLEAYYKFNEGTPGGTNTGITTLPDLTANNHDGMLVNFALTGASSNWVADANVPTSGCVPAEALHFNGGSPIDKVNAGTDPLLDISVGTWSAWVKLDNTSSTKRILFKQTSDAAVNSAAFALVANSGGSFRADARVGGTVQQAAGTTLPVVGTWYHVTGSYDGEDLKVYVNGILEGTNSTPSGNIDAHTGYLGLGGDISGNTNPFIGSLDEVRVWNRVLCVEEINQYMNCEIAGAATGLLLNYHFNQGLAGADNSTVTTLTDDSGNGLNGTLENFTLTGSTSNWIAPGAVTTGNNCAIIGTTTGCTDATACNYDASAVCDDGSCLTDFGCTNATACNYDATATCDDGSCLTVYGCTNPIACNYDAMATCDDGSCTGLFGCTDASAPNYNPAATCDDGTCNVPANALHFDGVDDKVNCGSDLNLSMYYFGTWEAWVKLDDISVDQRVIFKQKNNTSGTQAFQTYFQASTGVFRGSMRDILDDVYQVSSTTVVVPGVWYHVAVTYRGGSTDDLKIYINGILEGTNTNVSPTIFDDDDGALGIGGANFNNTSLLRGSVAEVRIWNTQRTASQISCYVNCEIPINASGLVANYHFNQGINNADNTAITTLTESTTLIGNGTLLNFTLNGTTSNWTSNFNVTAECALGCTNPLACNYNAAATCDDGSCTGLLGCTNPLACNYNAAATCDDGSCTGLLGCTNPLACNYDAMATCDDGSCLTNYGCTNPTACNYDATATCDDGTCLTNYGCTNPTACNYDATATCDDGSCILPNGCTNPSACNYNPTATCDDGSCLTNYGCTNPTACNYDASATCDDGSCLTDYGCTNSTACNYDATATCDDGSCLTDYGCTNPLACNYNATATCDDGSCLADYGCMNPLACNYDATATCDDGSCLTDYGCTNPAACNYDASATCDDGSCLTDYGCTNPLACNYNVTATCDDGSCLTDYGCMNPLACNYNATATCDDGSCLTNYGCTNPLAVNYNAAATCDDSSCHFNGCTYASAANFNPLALDDDGSCIWSGCTNPAALNFHPLATVDDGSCIVPVYGCTYPDATNYNPAATHDDDSCTFLLAGCPGDFDNNGTINVSDLLFFMGVFGTICP